MEGGAFFRLLHVLKSLTHQPAHRAHQQGAWREVSAALRSQGCGKGISAGIPRPAQRERTGSAEPQSAAGGLAQQAPSCAALGGASGEQAGSLGGTGASRQRGRCCGESKTCHLLQGAHSGSPSLQERLVAPWGQCCGSLGNDSRGQPGNVAQESPHTDTAESSLHSHPLHPSNHTVSSGPSSGGTVQATTPPTPPRSQNQ